MATGRDQDPTGAVEARPGADDDADRRRYGGLAIEERRSWAPWQVAAAALLFAVVGIGIGRSGDTATVGDRQPSFTLPPRPNRSAVTTTVPGPEAGVDNGAVVAETTTTTTTAVTPETGEPAPLDQGQQAPSTDVNPAGASG